jgi:sialate O-acetylesterase
LNGELIGQTGIFPPHYQSAYNATREYAVPEKYIRFGGDNVIAVRVYDGQLRGGIIDGDIGLYENLDAMAIDVNLAGRWKFKTGDNMEWKNANLDDNSWKPITVPGFWEPQGWPNYDGFAWYRLKFWVSSELANKKLVLVLGKIDDIDEAFINGEWVGATGDLNGNLDDFNKYDQYKQFRGYWISAGVLIPNKENVIAVRVYDGYRDGGIYQGPIGLIEQSKYVQYFRIHRSQPLRNQSKNFWDWFFN